MLGLISELAYEYISPKAHRCANTGFVFHASANPQEIPKHLRDYLQHPFILQPLQSFPKAARKTILQFMKEESRQVASTGAD